MESYIQKLRNSLVHFSCFDMLELNYYRVYQQVLYTNLIKRAKRAKIDFQLKSANFSFFQLKKLISAFFSQFYVLKSADFFG